MRPGDNNDTLTDFITGRLVPIVGAESNRQRVERFLVEEKGYSIEEIRVDAPIWAPVPGGTYRSVIDLAVGLDGRTVMVIKCAAGSLGSRERETLAAARLFEDRPVPMAVVSDGNQYTVLDVETGKVIDRGPGAVPDRPQAAAMAKAPAAAALPEEHRRKEALIFRTYDSMNVNVRSAGRTVGQRKP
jgi:hypothetical protein